MALSVFLVRAAAGLIFVGTTLGAHAAFRCDSNGSVTYTDTACAGGTAVTETDLRQPAAVDSDQRAAQLRAEANRSQLGAIEATRNKTERAQQKEQNHARIMASNHRKKCDALALKTKWAHEDAATASSRNVEKTKRKSHRLGEKYALECQV